MKVKLCDNNKRKSVYDILNIFYDPDEIFFVDENPDILISYNKIVTDKKDTYYGSIEELKRILYRILVDDTGYESPWGFLTGSKPTKLLRDIGPQEMIDKYLISDEKLDLLMAIISEQDKIDFQKDDMNLYINIPFCPTRCDYCSYPTLIGPNHDRSGYIDLLIREINEINLTKDLDTIYIGGGTPTNISEKDLERLLLTINNRFNHQEFTVEAGREDTLSSKKLEILREAKVDRISLNPQTFNEEIIISVGRKQNLDHFYQMYDMAKDLGFIINMDFIVGLVGEDSKMFAKNFEILSKLSPENITFHALAIKSGSKYKELDKRGSVDEALKIGQMIDDFTGANTYKPYYLYRQKNIISNLENIGYQRDGTAQRYNIVINEEIENVVGLGMNANSKLMNGRKYRNPRNMKDYTESINNSINDKNTMIEEYIKAGK